jgi:ribosomal protein L40E
MRTCSGCLAKNEDQAERCGKCGADLRPLREAVKFKKIIRLFRVLKPLDKPLSEGGRDEKLYDVYVAYLEVESPRPYYIFDADGAVFPRRLEYSLERLEKEAVEEYLKPLPTPKIKEIVKALSDAGLLSVGKDEKPSTSDLAEALASNYLGYQAVPRLREVGFLRSINWREEVVNPIISFKTEKDERLKALHKSHLLRGLSMRLNPHSITCTNGGTGKTEFYKQVGENVDRSTPISPVGYAKSPLPEDVFIGTVHGSELPINIDQIESLVTPQIVRHMFNLLESGEAMVWSGAATIGVTCRSIFNFSANPINYSSDASKSFELLLRHLSLNPALGRRIAIIIYGNDFKRIETKPSEEDLKEWSGKVSLFRAVEEYCRKTLIEMVNGREVWGWLNKPIVGYSESIKKIVEEADLKDENVRDFLLEHTAAQTRIRAAALYAVLADRLDKIALGDFELSELLEEAEDRLLTYIRINLDSITNIAKAWKVVEEVRVETYFKNAPDYMKEIVCACILHKKANPSVISVALDEIPYKPEKYAYLSKCIDRLKKRVYNSEEKRLDAEKLNDEVNTQLRPIFNFQIVIRDGGFAVEYLGDLPKSVEKVKPIGRYMENIQFSAFSNSPQPEISSSIPTGAKPKEYGCSLCKCVFSSEADLSNMKTHQTEGEREDVS